MIKELICTFWGHVVIHPALTQDGQPIFYERCPRCGEVLTAPPKAYDFIFKPTTKPTER